MATEIAYAGYPSAVVFDEPNGKAVQHLLWGDWIRIEGTGTNGWMKVHARGQDGHMRATDIQETRLLELVFVDIGQGDGALLVTPDDKHLLVDAGQEDNMHRFLRWRYGRFEKPFRFEAAIITHSDQDHYKGFEPIFENPAVSVGTIYHNGIIERAGEDPLGPKEDGFLTEVVATQEELGRLLSSAEVRGRRLYPNMLFNALQSGRIGEIRSLCSNDRHVPGFGPDSQSGVTIEVLGPVVDRAADGKPRLRWFNDVGKTKNGHSVVLRVVYGGVSVLLGGDLNTPAEYHLLGKHTGHNAPPKTEAEHDGLLQGGRRVFRSDIAKACHHGSADFTDLFLRAIDPIATVISSGDDEPHAHPRADSLGAVGRWGRGRRPLVFSTELARSAPEMIKHPSVLRGQIAEAQARLAAAADGEPKQKAQTALDKILNGIDRSVAVYGAINLRTDGKQVVMAQKIERPGRPDKKWDIYRLEPDQNGILSYVSPHA
jgi:beta-lactamase superfamily II metal-dependent hydrolase